MSHITNDSTNQSKDDKKNVKNALDQIECKTEAVDKKNNSDYRKEVFEEISLEETLRRQRFERLEGAYGSYTDASNSA